MKLSKILWFGLLLSLLVGCAKEEPLMIRFAKYPRFQVCIKQPLGWVKAEYNNGVLTNVENSDDTLFTESDFVVLYRNHHIAYKSKEFDSYPESTQFLIEKRQNGEIFSKSELTDGNDKMQLIFERSRILRDRGYFTSVIRNNSKKRVRIIRFGGFKKIETRGIAAHGDYMVSTVTNDFFYTENFSNWYMDSEVEWLEPGEEVFDPINYGAKSNWAYQVETEDGETYWFGHIH